MRPGVLHPDAANFARRLHELAGVDLHVAQAWIGTVYGWGRYDPNHGYGVAPGRHRSTAHAARFLARRLEPLRLNTMQPAAQVVTIGNNPELAGDRRQLLNAWAEAATRDERLGIPTPAQLAERRAGGFRAPDDRPRERSTTTTTSPYQPPVRF